jgi:NAD-specific glutamate dehydrogenase
VSRQHPEVERLRQLLKDIQSTSEVDLAMLAVAERELRRLAERT